jgi:hypothetical protein
MSARIVRMKLQDEYISICCPVCGKVLFKGTREQARRLIIYCTKYCTHKPPINRPGLLFNIEKKPF